MPPDLILAYFDPQDFPADFARLLRKDGFRLVSGPRGAAVRPAEPDRAPARALFLQPPPGQGAEGTFRAFYARARRADAPADPPDVLRQLLGRGGVRP